MENSEQNTEKQNKFKPFSFKGRIGKKTYRKVVYICTIAIALMLILMWIGSMLDNDIYINDPVSIIIVVVVFAVAVIAAWISWASAAKRFHDLGHSGRRIFFLPFGWFSLFSKDGEPGDNEYGPNPKE